MGRKVACPKGFPLFRSRLGEEIPGRAAVSVGPIWHMCIATRLAFRKKYFTNLIKFFFSKFLFKKFPKKISLVFFQNSSQLFRKYF